MSADYAALLERLERWGSLLLASLLFGGCGYVIGLVLASERFAVFDSQIYRALRRLLPPIWAVLGAPAAAHRSGAAGSAREVMAWV
ncbi:hypothetical protein KBZ18_04970 [Synechococcus sp. Cruz-9H2]|uniref:hypothetical protein n=1 Tax=unclassified Synechococcus TaxID=2626047 RepID=UPI0020CF8305|nr:MULTISPECIES: hypothetical protein [unclassified Synechococcus]MCP9818841.1 hypothetical protein [Synechococcus sp. Cruz-9H2]MCP9843344.1 hypothetical protein [Synechococcus sp. Edmonson 11F2]MCP9855273.1 hypothetical protein [Synechococcus sp. Cruz-9C9]MCP9862754.1 hypothetical protein [Synechococcus sp. Cruz-7E5]MCP9869751.1 hypothetical protein [Synechococcus sp. Cruz-7B9]